MNTTTDGKASAVLSEYVMVIFKGGLGSWLPYCSLEGKQLKCSNSLLALTNRNLLEWVPPTQEVLAG